MDNYKAVIRLAVEERRPNPSQISLALAGQFDPGADSGMHKQIVTQPECIDEGIEEFDMAGGNGGANGRKRVRFVQVSKLPGIEPVALGTFGASEPKPARQQTEFAGNEPKQDLLMVAEEKHGREALAAKRPQPFDNLAGLRSSINQVAKEDDEGIGRRPTRNVAFNVDQKPIEEIEPSVDIADGISPPSVWCARH